MLTAIICTYNREKYIDPLLDSIAANDLAKEEYEILLVDNNCTDNTREVCKAFAAAHRDVISLCILMMMRWLTRIICVHTQNGLTRIPRLWLAADL